MSVTVGTPVYIGLVSSGRYCIAIGKNAEAVGLMAVAIGDETKAVGDYAVDIRLDKLRLDETLSHLAPEDILNNIAERILSWKYNLTEKQRTDIIIAFLNFTVLSRYEKCGYVFKLISSDDKNKQWTWYNINDIMVNVNNMFIKLSQRMDQLDDRMKLNEDYCESINFALVQNIMYNNNN